MLFNSLAFVLFFLVVVVATSAAPKRARNAVLLAASCYFYMRFVPVYILILAAIIVVDYALALAIAASDDQRRRRWCVAASVVSNLGLLFVFKYFDFANQSLGAIAAWLGTDYHPSSLSLLLPLGLSFHTFQSISYVVDVHRGEVPAERNLLDYSLYVLFFPQLVAGPIERAAHILPQLKAPRPFDWGDLALGSQLMLWGLFKKVVVADRMALYVDAVYDHPGQHGGASCLLATYCFAAQIYCDFSGYSDIARGAARCLGVEMVANFNRPYFAESLRDFWRRWHISLSSWLRDYLYISLGGNRRGRLRTHLNLMATMVLGGLWHGASWNFAIWGAIHGSALSAEHLASGPRSTAQTAKPLARRLLAWLVTFHVVCLAWIFFRARHLDDALGMIGSLARPWGIPFLAGNTLTLAALGAMTVVAVEIAQERRGSMRAVASAWPLPLRWAGWIALIMAIVLIGVENGSQFIYFQF
jgi:D-alanyl-lipoteichoic acid acyltransferase DltB (MBOAT superfamily)